MLPSQKNVGAAVATFRYLSSLVSVPDNRCTRMRLPGLILLTEVGQYGCSGVFGQAVTLRLATAKGCVELAFTGRWLAEPALGL